MLRSIFAAFGLLVTFCSVQSAMAMEFNMKNAVGRLDMGSNGFCTATLVHHDVVLTAAHCLFDKSSGDRFALSELRFRLDPANASAIGVKNTLVHPDYRPHLLGELSNLSSDIALLKLDGTVAADTVALAQPDTVGAKATVVSFAKGRSQAARVQQNCALMPHSDGVLLTLCEANFGTSGAPVVQQRDGRAVIVSIVSAMAKANGERVALVVPVANAFEVLFQSLDVQPQPARFGR
ncbi:V8-like Glu-specific endopeptidase [Cognatishimia activa]|uniref:V8-like Glu-specific endopeptidase n=2 Tax=Cognatishimia activa TaxID=1715691 RepID=A0A0P1IUU6_9RHOB|nr:trypsin-like serine protease [Cognatishimia activa]CUI50174.1 V8-like Glu-specific endopeptidase [Cognatishimia activa]CUK27366.1 V8-like Glu-specific endopeptidase [Cognatishimia activa]